MLGRNLRPDKRRSAARCDDLKDEQKQHGYSHEAQDPDERKAGVAKGAKCSPSRTPGLANHRLGQARLGLSEQELSGPCDGFFESIIATLNHILIVDWYDDSALEGECMGPSAFGAPVPCPQLSDCILAQRAIDQILVRLCENPAFAVPDREIQLLRGDRVESDRFDRVFLHLVPHQIHHCGQVRRLNCQVQFSSPASFLRAVVSSQSVNCGVWLARRMPQSPSLPPTSV